MFYFPFCWCQPDLKYECQMFSIADKGLWNISSLFLPRLQSRTHWVLSQWDSKNAMFRNLIALCQKSRWKRAFLRSSQELQDKSWIKHQPQVPRIEGAQPEWWIRTETQNRSWFLSFPKITNLVSLTRTESYYYIHTENVNVDIWLRNIWLIIIS